jgi:hypothetical protein
MKRRLLILIVPIFGTFICFAQTELTVTAPAPNGATTGVRAPNGTTSHTTLRGVQIIPASELTAIPVGTTITKLGLILATAPGGPAGGTMEYFLENTSDVTNLKPTDWTTIVSTMTSVYAGSLALPAAAGPADVTLTSGFVYTGGSLYVAFDYAGTTFTTTGAVYSANNTIAASWRGLATAVLPAANALTGTTAFRPCFRFTFSNPFTNELNVSGIAGETGIFNNTIKTTQTVTSIISNTSQGDLTNIPVTLTVTGANPYTVTQTIPTITAGLTSTLLFDNVPTSTLGSQTLTISLPADQNNTNNSLSFTQQVQCDTISYAQSPVQSGGVGFNTGAGLIANKFTIPSTIETYVKSVSNYFPIAASNAGNTMKGILLDGNGVILDSTAVINVTAGMLGTKQNFDFINGAIDVSGGDIYVGFRQDANTTLGYFPFANQNNSYIDPNAAATFNLFGGGLSPLGSGLGYMMIEATLTFGTFDAPNSSTNGTVCANSELTISPPAGYTNYNFFVNGTSVQNGPSSTYTSAAITAGLTFNVDITNGACPVSSNIQTISIVSALVNNISAGICPGETYTFGSQTLIAGGSYSDTLPSVSGCDSIINLTLASLQPTSSALNVSICQGDTYTLGNQILSTTGVYTEVIPNAAGCDSTVTLNLTVNNPSSSSISLIVCENVYVFGTQTLNTTGVYTETFTNAAGCDSIVTLNLTMNPPITMLAFASGVTLNATGSSSINAYQWIDCATDNPIVGATSSTFSPTVNGSYAVIGTNPAGCVETSNCVTVSTIGIEELSLDAKINIYPNPATTTVNIVSNGGDILSYTLVDASGRVVLSEIVDGGTKEVEFSVQSIENGAYILELKTVGGTIAKHFVKK